MIALVKTFRNFLDYLMLARGLRSGAFLTLETRSGLKIKCRNNQWDVRIVGETFLDRTYLKHLKLDTKSPVVVDVGGYIGDFSLYVAAYLDAKVVVYEPMPENYELLEKNVEINGLQGVIKLWNKALSSSGEREVTINVARRDKDVHASGYLYSDTSEKIQVGCTTLDEIFEDNKISDIDVLKVDCEGCEYDALLGAGSDTLRRIKNIVFEYHPIPGWKERLRAVQDRLVADGYSVVTDDKAAVVTARRAG